jgi:hypothetical protein
MGHLVKKANIKNTSEKAKSEERLWNFRANFSISFLSL